MPSSRWSEAGWRAIAALVAAGAWLAAAPTAEAGPASRLEAHVVATQTLGSAQLLAGSRDGTPASIAGELRLPSSAEARVPAVLFLHGDAGEVANQPVWIDALNAAGFAVFTLDSFSGRGAVATGAALNTMPDSIGGLARVVDAEAALALLARHPRIDPTRIAVMGVSSGGRTVLALAQKRFSRAYGTPGLAFAAYVALYPSCNVTLAGDTDVEAGPIRIYHGLDDVLTSAAACERYVDRLRAAGHDAAFTGYRGAHHGFDNVAAAGGLTRFADYPNFARCNVEEIAPGRLVNADTGRPATTPPRRPSSPPSRRCSSSSSPRARPAASSFSTAQPATAQTRSSLARRP